MKALKSSHVFWFALIVGVIVRLLIVFQPETNVLTRWGSDDLFYYSQIAGHVANGDGFTFDGIHATNGFQPLFLFALIPFGSMMLNDWYFAWIVVSLLVTVISVLVCFQLRKLALEMGWSDWISVLLPSVFFLHPKILSVTFNGTEGALSMLMLVMSLRAFVWVQKGERLYQASLIFSLLVLTRMEFSLFLFFLFVYGMITKQDWKRWLSVCFVPAFVFGAWLFLNYAAFGDIVPSSGQAKAIHSAWYDFSFAEGLRGAIGTLFYAESSLSAGVIGLVLVGSLVLWRQRESSIVHLPFFLFLSSVVLLTLALIQLKGFRDWYLMPQYLLVCILVAFALDWIVSKKWGIVLPLLLFALWGEAQWHPRSFDGREIVRYCEQVKKEVPKGSTIGIYNAGLPATCLADEYRAINLDGVVNNSVLPFLEQEKLGAYIREEGIDYLFDMEASLNFYRRNASRGAGGLLPLKERRKGMYSNFKTRWILQELK